MPKEDHIKKHLVETFISMCDGLDMSKISVQTLCEVAGISRQAFYNRFLDINDLICYIASLPLRAHTTSYCSIDELRDVFSMCTRHRGFFIQLARHEGQNSYWTTLAHWNIDYGFNHFVPKDLPENEKAYRHNVLQIWNHGVSEAIRQWCATGLTSPIDSLSRAIYDTRPSFIPEKGTHAMIEEVETR